MNRTGGRKWLYGGKGGVEFAIGTISLGEDIVARLVKCKNRSKTIRSALELWFVAEDLNKGMNRGTGCPEEKSAIIPSK